MNELLTPSQPLKLPLDYNRRRVYVVVGGPYFWPVHRHALGGCTRSSHTHQKRWQERGAFFEKIFQCLIACADLPPREQKIDSARKRCRTNGGEESDPTVPPSRPHGFPPSPGASFFEIGFQTRGRRTRFRSGVTGSGAMWELRCSMEKGFALLAHRPGPRRNPMRRTSHLLSSRPWRRQRPSTSCTGFV
jgi:hypothetical protein